MSDNGTNADRRRFLTTAATVVGGAGVAASAVPFISAMTPSAKTKAIGAPVEVDIGGMQPGDRKVVQWQGKPVWILRRDNTALESLEELGDKLRDPASDVTAQQPAYARNEYRSIKPEYLVVIGLCTHLGCSPTYVPKGEGEGHNLSASWQGGFFCPCHGSRFDLAGRVFKDVPAPSNLVVPPYHYISDKQLLIGKGPGETA